MTAAGTNEEQDQGNTKKVQPQEPEPSREATESRRKPPVRLVRESDGIAVADACGTCGRVYTLNDSFAAQCCDPRCADCGCELPLSPRMVRCDSCGEKRRAVVNADLRAKAKRIPESEYDGPVYHDGAWNEGFLRDTDELREWADDQETADALPREVWACHVKPLRLPSAEQLCEDMVQDSFDDAYNQLVGIEELQVAVDVFNAKQTAEEWEPDFSRLIVLAPEVRP